MGHGEMNGYPRWAEFAEAMDRGFERMARLQADSANRIHDRLTASEGVLHKRIDGVRTEVIRLGATMAAQQAAAVPAPPALGRLARTKAWAEQIAALRELLLLLCLAIAGLTAVVQAPEIAFETVRLMLWVGALTCVSMGVLAVLIA